MSKFSVGEIIHMPMAVKKIEGDSLILSYVDDIDDVEYDLTVDEWALDSLILSRYVEEHGYKSDMMEQVELIVSSKVEVAKDKINKFVKDCHENNVDILGIEPIMSFTGVGSSNKIQGAIMVGAMIRYLVPVYDSNPVDE